MPAPGALLLPLLHSSQFLGLTLLPLLCIVGVVENAAVDAAPPLLARDASLPAPRESPGGAKNPLLTAGPCACRPSGRPATKAERAVAPAPRTALALPEVKIAMETMAVVAEIDLPPIQQPVQCSDPRPPLRANVR